MKNEVHYEWSLEQIKDDEIVDIDFSESLSKEWLCEANCDICLVRNAGNDSNGVVERYWAYVKNSKLPEFFSNSYGDKTSIKVPKKFNLELNKLILK